MSITTIDVSVIATVGISVAVVIAVVGSSVDVEIIEVGMVT